ncbi:MAG TPA: SDR family NAD(P)-dependent oxidoreductase [Longimicrobiaceae bacterium]|nr:SDR family NAD(P)-dependent oxidoreductase [Longimicrobiaceae bacterium]
MRGEVVLVTGGSRGIGLASARRFAAAGARVVLVARDEDRLAGAAAELGDETVVLPADLTSGTEVTGLVRAVEERIGRVDVLVNCAGQLEVGPAERLGPPIAERLTSVNYLGPVRLIHACLPLLRRGTRRSIVCVSSLAGKIAPPYMAAYAASKFALTAYCRSLRQELRPEGFHVGLVFPGPVDTAMIEGRIRTRYYPLPPGTPVLDEDAAAAAVVHTVLRRADEWVVPRRLAAAMRLGQAFPGVVDVVYRLMERGRAAP